MKTLTYKKSTIETILTEDNQPVFIAVVDGIYYTNQTADSNEEKCIKKAKAVINNRKK